MTSSLREACRGIAAFGLFGGTIALLLLINSNPAYMKTFLILALFAAFIALGVSLMPAADAPPKAPEKLEDVQKERDALKTRVADLEEQVRQLNIATAELQRQRDEALNSSVMRAMQKK